MSLLVTGASMLGLGEACGTATVSPSEGGVDASAPCLTSIAENGASCSAPETLHCYAAIDCAPTPQQADCDCVSGKWQCSYAAKGGGVIAPGSKPACFNEIDAAPGSCPAHEPGGDVLCNQPGLVCTYPGLLCPESDSGQPNTDTCQCAPSTSLAVADGAIISGSDGGLVWACDRQLCNPTSDAMIPPPPDTGVPDSGVPDADATTGTESGPGPEAGKDVKSGKG